MTPAPALAAELVARCQVPAPWAPAVAAGMLSALAELPAMAPRAAVASLLGRVVTAAEVAAVVEALAAVGAAVVDGGGLLRRAAGPSRAAYHREWRAKKLERQKLAAQTIEPPKPLEPQPLQQQPPAPVPLVLLPPVEPAPKRPRPVRTDGPEADEARAAVAAWSRVVATAATHVDVQLAVELPWGQARTRDQGLLRLVRAGVTAADWRLIAEWVVAHSHARTRSRGGWIVSMGWLCRDDGRGTAKEKVNEYLGRARDWDVRGRPSEARGGSVAARLQADARDRARDLFGGR